MKNRSDMSREIEIGTELRIQFAEGKSLYEANTGDNTRFLILGNKNTDDTLEVLTKNEVLNLIGELKWFYDRM